MNDQHGSVNYMKQVFKEAIEKVRPEFRQYMRPAIPGRVVAVDEDAFTVDVEVDDVPQGEDKPATKAIYPAVPVQSISAGHGFGLWAIPQIGAEVTISFKDFDVTRPQVDGAEFLLNKTPLGSRVGSFTIADDAGQRFTLRPDTGEVVIRAYNVDDQASGTRSEYTGGRRSVEVAGDDEETVGGNATRVVKGDKREVVEGVYHFESDEFEEHGDWDEEIAGRVQNFQHALIVNGAARRKINGREDHQVLGDRKFKVLGDDFEAVARNRSTVIGGILDVMVAGVVDDPRHLAALQIGAPLGINAFGGFYQEPTTGTVVGRPMVDGISLATALTAYLEAIEAAFVVYNTAVGLLPDPVPSDALAAATLTLTGTVTSATTALVALLWTGYTPTTAPPAWVLSPRHFMGGPF